MLTSHPFRFGVVAAMARTGEEWLSKARRVESLGYATLVMPDGLKYSLAPLPALAAAATATRTLRVGTYVIANDFRNPVLLAKEAATVDLLSGGRFELGIGAGRPGAEADNRMLGVAFDSGGVRLARLAESLGLLKQLLAGQTATAPGPHYAAADAEISPQPVQQPRPPILVAASGKQMLALAAREADIVALGVPPGRLGGLGGREDRLDPRCGRRAVRPARAQPESDGGRPAGATLRFDAARPHRREPGSIGRRHRADGEHRRHVRHAPGPPRAAGHLVRDGLR